ncbi:MAG: hypothetical protein DWQ05_02005 [Calditrichaeota bacterium]|nr:MAG: hypothetical protein DWQ05_02005 [Calditrichota bacterium]
MNFRTRRLQKLVGLFLFAIVLFNYPLLSIFNRDAVIAGIPLLFYYIFTAWLLIIIFLFIVIERPSLARMPKSTEKPGE